MPKPTVAGKYFDMLKVEIEAADHYRLKIIMQNANAYCMNIKIYADLPTGGHSAINAVLRGTAALGVALSHYAEIGPPGQDAINGARSLVLKDVERLGDILETCEPSQRRQALG